VQGKGKAGLVRGPKKKGRGGVQRREKKRKKGRIWALLHPFPPLERKSWLPPKGGENPHSPISSIIGGGRREFAKILSLRKEREKNGVEWELCPTSKREGRGDNFAGLQKCEMRSKRRGPPRQNSPEKEEKKAKKPFSSMKAKDFAHKSNSFGMGEEERRGVRYRALKSGDKSPSSSQKMGKKRGEFSVGSADLS